MEIKLTLKQVVDAVINHGGIINDHTDKLIPKNEIAGFVLLESGQIAQALKAYLQCLNAVYIDDDGKAHISTCSIAGNIYGNLCQECVDKYNKEMICQFNQDKKIVDYVVLEKVEKDRIEFELRKKRDEEIIDKIMEANFTLAQVVEAVNNHGGIMKDYFLSETMIPESQISGFVLLENGQIALAIKAQLEQAISAIYIDDDGKAHASRFPILGKKQSDGCIAIPTITGNIYGNLCQESIDRYNSEMIDQSNQGNKIVDYVLLEEEKAMETISTSEAVNLKDPKVVKEIILNTDGVYDENGKWINTSQILGVVKLSDDYLGCCCIAINGSFQFLNSIYLDRDMKLHISRPLGFSDLFCGARVPTGVSKDDYLDHSEIVDYVVLEEKKQWKQHLQKKQ